MGTSGRGWGLCQSAGARTRWGGVALKTRYVSFRPPQVAAVVLENRPPFFEEFAATIRHDDLGDGQSSIEYIFNFTARPKWLRPLLHPLMKALFTVETRKRLRALQAHFQRGQPT